MHAAFEDRMHKGWRVGWNQRRLARDSVAVRTDLIATATEITARETFTRVLTYLNMVFCPLVPKASDMEARV